MRVRTGDEIKHYPTGEIWTVAAVDHKNKEISWIGWPEGWANMNDCHVVKRCDDEFNMKILKLMANMKNDDDHRKRYALRVLSGRRP